MQKNKKIEKRSGDIWPEIMVSVDDLKPFERNPRKITNTNYKKLKEDLSNYGLHNRVKATTDLRIIGGHQRIKALKELGYTQIPVLVPPEGRVITDDEFMELMVKDNLHAGDFNYGLLLEDNDKEKLLDWGIQMSLLQKEVDRQETPAEAEEVPDLGSTAISKRGDIWVLGQHRLRCGDSTAQSEVIALLASGKAPVPNLMVTDPPYGVDYDPQWRTDAGVNKRSQKVATGKVMNDNRCDWREAWALFTGNVAYVWHGGLHSAMVAESLQAAGFVIRSQIIWAKKSLVMGRGNYHWQHEPCWYAVRKGENGNYVGDRKQSTLWDIANMHSSQGNVDDGKTNHSTQKPVECMRRPIENNSNMGDSVYEPFCGSGTTLIACELTGRACYAMELDPLYVDMAVKRWQNFTNQTAVHAETGKAFGAK